MSWNPEKILFVLDKCNKLWHFPTLNNAYRYLAATRMSLYRSELNWALVIKIFGFFNQDIMPDTNIYTFASHLYNRNKPNDYISRQAYKNYLLNHPCYEHRSIYPIEDNGENWIDSQEIQYVLNSGKYILRGQEYSLPILEDYKQFHIELEESKAQIFEFARFLAATQREKVLANERERRISVLPEMKQILQLESWNHPAIADGESPSDSITFRQLAMVLATGDTKYYNPTQPPNTDWINWLDGGIL